MTEVNWGKPCLVIDAAGPLSLVGITEQGRWRALTPSEGPSMENLDERVRGTLRSAGLSLEELEGAWYAEGPGSTLGLRLAAMFLQILRQKPGLSHWSLSTYNNLEVSAAACLEAPPRRVCTLHAPWKKGFYHRARLNGPERPIALDTCTGDELAEPEPSFVRLGLKRASIPPGATEIPYPYSRIPELVALHPALLRPVSILQPYSPVPPDFARWEGKRHSAP